MNRDTAPVILKVSGKALGENACFEADHFEHFVNELKSVAEVAGRVVLVIGGGNILRGGQSTHMLLPEDGHTAGMFASALNGMIAMSKLRQAGLRVLHVSTLGRLEVGRYVEPFNSEVVSSFFKEPGILILSSGTGKPGPSTDSGTIKIAEMLGAKLIIKGTNVDGIYSADPRKDKSATLIGRMTPDEFVARRFEQIFDPKAIEEAGKNGRQVRVINFFAAGNLLKALRGENVGTLIAN